MHAAEFTRFGTNDRDLKVECIVQALKLRELTYSDVLDEQRIVEVAKAFFEFVSSK